MLTLYVRNFPEDLYEQVKKLAAENRRSLSAEAIVLLENAFQSRLDRARHMEALRRIDDIRNRNPQPPGAQSVVDMIREDRER